MRETFNMFHKCNLRALLLMNLSFFLLQLESSCEIIELNRQNFEALVFHDTDPWIVGLEEKTSTNAFEEVYDQIKDRINVGIIDKKEYVAYLQDQDAPANGYFFEAFRVYPFGAKLHKINKWENAELIDEAIKKAFASIPDITSTLPNTVDGKNSILRDFIQQSYANLPPKFPVVLFTDYKRTPLYYKQIALKFSGFFSFAVIRNPPPSTMAIYAIPNTPRLVVLFTEILKDGTPRIKPIQYDESVHGSLDYPKVLRFLYLVHMKYFQELPGHAHISKIDVDEVFGRHIVYFPELLRLPEAAEKEATKGKLLPSLDDREEDIHRKYEACNENADVCMIIVDKALNTSQEKIVQLDQIAAHLLPIQKQVTNQGRTSKLNQLDINCNEETEIKFDIYTEDVPVLLRPKKRLFVTAVIEELNTSIETYVHNALAGKIGHRKYDVLPNFRFGNCQIKNQEQQSGSEDIKTEL